MELIGEKVGSFTIVEQLGAGGMGTVYRASDDDGGFVAIKTLHPHLLAVPGAFKRFLREAQLGQQIDHPNVVRSLDVDALTVGGEQVHFLVMELVAGQTLDRLLVELGTVPEELCRHIGIQISEALVAIHAHGAVHRDLKPSNVIITPDNEVKVMDFGIALLRDPAVALTEVGDFVGSVLYAAPEQWNPEVTVDARIDLFALGILLYELATGRHPFAGSHKSVPPSLITSTRPEPANLTRPELSDYFVELVAKLLETDPDNRFGSAELTRGILESGERAQWWLDREVELDRTGHVRARRIQVPRDSGVHGRERELDALAACMAQVREGRGQVVLLEGESGIGKTRLVDEFLRRDELLGREGGAAQFLFGSYPPGGAATIEGAFSTAFREHLGHADLERKLAPLLPELSALVPAFAALLRGEPAPEGKSALSAESIATVFSETTRALALAEPVILFLDDLHFAPAEARALFARMAQMVHDLPILLIGAFRPDGAGAWQADLLPLGHVRHMTLQRLTPAELASLLADAFGSDALADQLGWEIARKSDGNPLFVLEILRDLRERGQLVREDSGSWRSTGLIRKIDTPHSVRELIQGRLRNLDEIDRDLLDIASCCGYRFDPAIVAAASDLELIPALKRFRHLERDHSILRPDGREYVFDHHQMQEAVYADLFEQLREQYHATIGESCEKLWTDPTDAQAVALCGHFLKGRRADRSRPYLRRALEHLRGASLPAAVFEMASMALEAGEPKDPRERFEILALANGGANMTGDWETEKRINDEQVEIAEALGDDALQMRALLTRGTRLYTIAEFPESLAVFAEALELARAQDSDLFTMHAHRGLGVNYSRTRNNAKALEHHLAALGLSQSLNLAESEAGAHNNVALACVGEGDRDKAEQHYARAIELAAAIGERRWEAHANANWGRIHFERGDFASAWKCALRFRELTRLIGDRRGDATAGVIMCTLWKLFGSLEEMEHELSHVESWIDATRDRWLTSYVLAHRGWIAEQRGEFGKAVGFFEQAAELRRELGDLRSLADSLANVGSARLLAGRDADGIAALHEALAVEEQEPELPAAALSALCVAEPERVEEARAALAELDSKKMLSVSGPYCCWLATGDRADLELAHTNLADLQSRIPEEYHRSSLERVRVFRAVTEAWEDRGR